jgi:polysaccharide biosynthesis transport protein
MERPLPPPSLNGPAQNGVALPPELQSIPGLQTSDGMDLPKFLSMVRRRAVVIVVIAAAVLGYTTVSTLSQKRIYQSKFQLLVEPVNADNELSDLTKALGSAQGGGATKGTSALDYATQIQVLRSPALMAEIVQRLQRVYPGLSYGELLNGLTIVRPAQTKILEISYKDTDPVKIQTVLDALSQSYLQYSLIERQTNLRQGIQFIDQQMPELRQKFDQQQDQLQQFRQKYNFIDPDSRAHQITNKATGLDEKQQALQQKMVSSTSYYNQLQDENSSIAVLKDAPTYQRLIEDLRAVEVQIAAESTRFKEGNINIKLLQEKRDNLIPILQAEAQRVLGAKRAEAGSELEILRGSQQNLLQAEGQLKQETEAFAVLSRRYTDMQRELQIAHEALNRFLENRQSLQIKAAQTEIPWQVIEAPVKPTIPISPDVKRNIMMGLVMGLAGGVGVAMLLEKLDRVYHTVEDIKRDVKLPLLGQLPIARELVNKSETQIERLMGFVKRLIPKSGFSPFKPSGYGGYYGYGGSSSFLEALRILYTNLQLLSSDQPIRSITISSAMPGDGKSTVSTYLAQTAVAMGQRVLLIDCDLRRPQIHARMNLSNERGLSDLITSDITSQAVLSELQDLPGLTVLTAGSIPPDPTKLLSSQKMRQLMKVFAAAYDLVIYDTPPLVGLADASLLAPHTDGLILVMRMEQTDRSAVKQAVENLKMSQIPTLGLVVNAVPRTSTNNYTYYQYQRQPQQDLSSLLPEEKIKVR